ncbi:MAG: zinc ribbon domain-containing protein, partial [Deltaproteobacteria bacterium]|nr:zinc ribbon domain-containing protein [Deltaproteobacteria bacterium]
MKICPQCQTAYDDTKNFCHHDGASLATPQVNEKSVPPESRTCSQCGTPAEAEEQFCSHCGAKLEGTFSPAAHKENPLARSVHKLQSLITDYYQQLPPEKSEFHRGAA